MTRLKTQFGSVEQSCAMMKLFFLRVLFVAEPEMAEPTVTVSLI